MPTDDPPDKSEQNRKQPGDSVASKGIALGVAAFLAGTVTAIILSVFPVGSARAGPVFYVLVVLAFILSVFASSYRAVMALLVEGLTAQRLLLLLVIPGILLLPLSYVVLNPEESIGRRACTFGPFGIAKGTVWFKVVPPAPAPNEARAREKYQIDMVWGAAEVHKSFWLSGPTYFAFNQEALRAPGADISVAPPNAHISCGFGNPPRGANRIDLTGDDFMIESAD